MNHAMEGFMVHGGECIQGVERIQAAKNAVLPILAAAILTEDEVLIRDCPELRDVHAMTGMLKMLGCRCEMRESSLSIQSSALHNWEMPDEISKEIRSSIFLLGPILGRLRKATVTYPGGCEIGIRPIDLHLKGLKALGVKISDDRGILYCDGKNMHAGDVYLDYPSVGATENVMMAAALLPGVTYIHNAAREPEIEDLQQFINAMGGCVRGAGTQLIEIEGVERLHGACFTPMPDRIVAGTLLCAAAITGGEITLENVRPWDMIPMEAKLAEMGCRLYDDKDRVHLSAPKRLQAFSALQTQPHPGFPTDMQAQMMAVSAVAQGTTVIVENVFENRFGHAADLARMGACIRVSDRVAVVQGVEKLHGNRVCARDLRGGAALVLAGLAAEGDTLVENVHLIDRGYAALEKSLSSLGARVERISI